MEWVDTLKGLLSSNTKKQLLEEQQRAEYYRQKYYAAEVDKHAIAVTKANYPGTVQLGDVTKWREWDIAWSSIDLLIGGSPCQGFSFAGKQLAFNDPRSALFFVYVDILNHIRSTNPRVKFLLENVKMKKEFLDTITEYLGVEPVFINSALVSAQNRQRYYWANWDFVQPADKGIVLADVLETNGDGCIKSHGEMKLKSDKRQCLDTNYHKGVDNHGQRTVVKCCAQRGRYLVNGKRADHTVGSMAGLTEQRYECRDDGKTNCLTTVQKDNLVLCDCQYRKLTPLECERLQTFPDNYTAHVSNTQRYKALGNSWTVDVVAHIFNNIK